MKKNKFRITLEDGISMTYTPEGDKDILLSELTTMISNGRWMIMGGGKIAVQVSQIKYIEKLS